MIGIRPERDEAETVHAIHAAAFETDQEARLVDRLRAAGDIACSLIALDGERAIGNVILSPMGAEIDGRRIRAVALGPIGVLPDRQDEGVGEALVQAAIAWARGEGFAAMFLLGAPEYYGRFGFSAEAARRFASPYAGEHWQALALDETFSPSGSGRADYAPAFAAFEGA
ncbi:MAG: GNAT family N-acetyltransferase [Parasphingopyxis sp.]|nr:N-acetyltransferase [Sphingomonadales bacterium]